MRYGMGQDIAFTDIFLAILHFSKITRRLASESNLS